ncbi:MAG: hypothetical protein MUF51_01250 [Vicinamibacteria bacterium]|nr:hypothetical protein [Vicinamibacteria bacterium]
MTERRILIAIASVASLLYLGTLSTYSLTRYRRLSPDAHNYIDVAYHIRAGQGLTQDTYGFNGPRPEEIRFPQPYSAQPPLFPLAIAAAISLGVRPHDAALAIPLLAYAGILLAGALFAQRVFGATAGYLAVLTLIGSHALSLLAIGAWSEPLALLWLMLALLVDSGPATPRRAFACGVLLALSALTRFIMISAAPIFALWIWRRPGDRRRGWQQAVTFCIGWCLPIVPFAPHYLRHPPVLPPSTAAWHEHFERLLRSLIAEHSLRRFPTAQILAALFLIAIMIAWPSARARLMEVLRRAPLLPLYAVFYAAALIALRMRSHFDPINNRLLAPTVMLLALILAGCLTALLYRPRLAMAALLIVTALRTADVVAAIRATPHAGGRQKAILNDERLSWIRTHTGARDLVIGDDTVAVASYLRRPNISISPIPYSEPVTEAEFARWRAQLCGAFDNTWLALSRSMYARPQEMIEAYGATLGPLFYPKSRAPDFELIVVLPETTIYRLRCAQRIDQS